MFCKYEIAVGCITFWTTNKQKKSFQTARRREDRSALAASPSGLCSIVFSVSWVTVYNVKRNINVVSFLETTLTGTWNITEYFPKYVSFPAFRFGSREAFLCCMLIGLWGCSYTMQLFYHHMLQQTAKCIYRSALDQIIHH